MLFVEKYWSENRIFGVAGTLYSIYCKTWRETRVGDHRHRELDKGPHLSFSRILVVCVRRESPLANRAAFLVVSAEILEGFGDIALVVISDQKFHSAENFPIVSALQLKLSDQFRNTDGIG